MLKADKLLITQLASAKDTERQSAALALQALPRGHFEDHPPSRKFIQGLQAVLLLAYQTSASELVRDWCVQLLADAQVMGAEMEGLVKAALQPECAFLKTLLYYISLNPRRFQDCKSQILRLSAHPDEEVRWRCAYVLEMLVLDYDSDAATLRGLFADSCETTRTYAVLAFKGLRRLEAEDISALQALIQTNADAASAHAQDLLAGRIDSYCSADPLAHQRG